ncbi:MAG TPA: DUF2249 domain-containing protein [Verrucomicrobiae bacterium]|nr:DUF2249 domain-containing protein [Verrucomicrobiae bacterium]
MSTTVLDLREELRRGGAPFDRIMAAAGDLGIGGSLVLIAPFEPAPLYSVLGRLGFTHTSVANDAGEWEIRFVRNAANGAQAETPAAKSAVASEPATSWVEIDARGLQPPEPLVKILEAVTDLPHATELRARTDRRPMHLYPQLEERGFSGVTHEQPDGSFITHICRR